MRKRRAVSYVALCGTDMPALWHMMAALNFNVQYSLSIVHHPFLSPCPLTLTHAPLLVKVGGPILRTTYAPDLASRTPLEPIYGLPTPVCEGSLAAHAGSMYFSNPSSWTVRSCIPHGYAGHLSAVRVVLRYMFE